MNTETLNTGIDRFSNYDNPLIAFEFIVIVALAVFILYREGKYDSERKDTIEVNRKLAESLAVLTEVVRNGNK